MHWGTDPPQQNYLLCPAPPPPPKKKKRKKKKEKLESPSAKNFLPSPVLELFNHHSTGGKKHENVNPIQKLIQRK